MTTAGAEKVGLRNSHHAVEGQRHFFSPTPPALPYMSTHFFFFLASELVEINDTPLRSVHSIEPILRLISRSLVY